MPSDELTVGRIGFGGPATPVAADVQRALGDPRIAPTYQWGDLRDQWSDKIDAAHPVNGGSNDAHKTAMDMVSNRLSKSALVNLVCWLLQGGR